MLHAPREQNADKLKEFLWQSQGKQASAGIWQATPQPPGACDGSPDAAGVTFRTGPELISCGRHQNRGGELGVPVLAPAGDGIHPSWEDSWKAALKSLLVGCYRGSLGILARLSCLDEEEIIHHPQPCSLLLPYEGWSNCILFPRDVPDNSSEQDLGKSGISLVAAPLVLGAVGFTGAGIAAGSLAAKMMSTAAIANGGGVAAGSMVAVLQSAGAAGLSLTTNIGLGAVGASKPPRGASTATNRSPATWIQDHKPLCNMFDFLYTAVGAGIGLGVAVVGVPVVLGAAGFTATGIAAGSIAAKMMSAAAIANGGGVAAGSAVAVMQSVGAAGLSGAAQGAIAAAGAAVLARKLKPKARKLKPNRQAPLVPSQLHHLTYKRGGGINAETARELACLLNKSSPDPGPQKASPLYKMVGILMSTLGASIGFGVAAVGVPVALGAAGFTAAGIAAGSIAAKMIHLVLQDSLQQQRLGWQLLVRHFLPLSESQSWFSGFHFPAQRQEIVGHHHSLQSVAGLQTSPEMVRATGSEVKPSNNKPVSYMARFVAPAVGAAVGLGIAFVGVPTALGAAGFTTAGVAAGSLAAKMMSAAAVANGGGLAAGGVVPCLQSLGALGLSGAAKGAVMATGTAIGALIRKR
ncbi:interferon alpha-inducible protein 27, mitochondrial [Alligator mississippiensis]|uniref:Interferon alpha-inducible protein 27, mitochondrial n=1 Tax=Alligator mississippiensis TaxID=8496 RepID=A0A151PH04_ALLMI|nr:interferon alpha-inducible protein 27, mitochondrial [Alligator mississippiensis]